MRVLLVEDHASLGESLQAALEGSRYVVDWVRSIAGAETALAATRYDLMLLDLGLPDGDGVDFLKKCRRSAVAIPILVLTARGGLNDRVDGLDGGADDYLVKPFDLSEMLSRCRALLRRPGHMESDVIELADVKLELSSGGVLVRGRPVMLPRREHQLLAALMRKAGRVSSRPYLENALYDQNTQAGPNALEAAVSRLRSVLKEHGSEVSLRTIRGVGYVLSEGDGGA